MPASTIDVSDFDPFSPTASSSSSSSRSSSPHPLGALFPGPRTAAPAPSSRASSSSATPALAAPTPQPVHAEGVEPGTDPLGGLLGSLALDPSPSTRHSPSPAPTATSSTAASHATFAQEQRNTRILRDLDRGPFAPPTPPTPLAPPPPSAPHSTPLSPSYADEPTSLPASPAVPIPSPSSPTRTTHRTPHSPSSTLHRRPSASFSPPRRLSTLMDTASFPHGPSSPPAESSILSDPFHAASSAAGAAWRRIRDASAGAGDLIEQAMEGEWSVGQGDTSGEWGEFQGGTPELPLNNGAGSSSARASAAPSPWAQPIAVPPSPHAHAPAHGGMGTLGRAASLPVSAAAAAGSSLSSGFSSLFGSAHPAEGGPSAASTSARKPSPPSPARAATTSGGAGGARTGGFDPTAQPVKLVGLRPGVQRVLEDDVAEGIRPSLPPRLRLSSRWTLLYSLDQHGISLTTLFSSLQRGLASRDGGFVLVVKTSRGDVCGAYVSEALRDGAREQRGSTRWQGDGSCFLWRATPFPPHDFRLGSSVQSFKPTFRNTYYAYATSTPSPVLASPLGGTGGEAFLAFGGGEDGQFGLWVDGVFERGWTGRSETFGNEPLVGGGRGVRGEKREGEKGGGGEEDDDEDEGEGRKFEIVGLECWAVGS
ncbi:uncharacterized protein RHOBADRAFT_53214 [Rhodotorula graminis WP1]|uniref:Oxidation resistance protein 1 n=1 Tax=Rhodotorula graminis (strain WP1) TaxID=578459 RepID=A0A194S391_RHOGW|nr:uncharacterized protein RHOBADRAFT_53214 [Rhodotorula graminis WP1]KPV75203.1 hypothetical protein RHOBADRAFT_53214 [Rhodotorula graminis WP1]